MEFTSNQILPGIEKRQEKNFISFFHPVLPPLPCVQIWLGGASHKTTPYPRVTVISPVTSQHSQILAVKPQYETGLGYAEPEGPLSLSLHPSPLRGCPHSLRPEGHCAVLLA